LSTLLAAAGRELGFLILDVLRAVALLAALVCGVGGVAGLLGALHPLLDLGSHLAPVWLAVGIIAAAAGVLLDPRPFKWPVVLGLAGAAAGGLLVAAELVSVRAPQPDAPGERLEIVQLNLWGKNADLPGTAAWILKEDADIVLLEEAASSPILPRLKDRYPYQITCAQPYSCAPVILLKQPPTAYGGVSTVPEANLTWVQVGGARPFTVAAVHHAKPYAPYHYRQVELTVKRLAPFDRRTLIVAGDFNATAWSHTLRREGRGLGLERRTRALPTWPTWAPRPILPIDHLFAGEAWRTVEVRRGPRVGSDHYPVVITLARGR
jgi:endonuclease/exonuclease/phosphatase (EEP) superfamily protein YafD